MNNEQAAEEKKKWAMKYFDYADNPIKKWIATYLEEDISVIFDDYQDTQDVLHIEENKVQYELSLAINGETPDVKVYQDSTRLKQGISVLYDSVRTVFMPVKNTIINMNHRMEDITCVFNEDLLCFEFIMYNGLRVKKDKALETLSKIQTQLGKLNEQKTKITTDENLVKINEIETKLAELMRKEITTYNELTDEALKVRDEVCNEVNEKLQKSIKLHIIIKVGEKPSDEEIMKRMPTFGLQYQDPDEDNYIDKLRKGND